MYYHKAVTDHHHNVYCIEIGMLVESDWNYFHNDIRRHFEGHNNENLYDEILPALIHASLKIRTYDQVQNGKVSTCAYLSLASSGTSRRKVPDSNWSVTVTCLDLVTLGSIEPIFPCLSKSLRNIRWSYCCVHWLNDQSEHDMAPENHKYNRH